MRNKIIPLLSLTKRDYRPKRILSQPKPVSTTPSKTYNNELIEIYNSLYEDFFPLILKLTKTSFFDKMDKKVKEIIFSGNSQKNIQISTNSQIVSKIKEDLSKKYDNEYKFLSREYQNYIKNNKKYNYLSHFRKHCAQTENIGLHYCSDKKRGKFIEIKTKNSYNKEETSYVICVECKQCYPSDFILMICVSCNKKFFSNILDEKEDINILPATWEKYHCGSMINEIMKCIKCHQTLYIDLITKKLVCKNKRCNFVSKPESILWKCFICAKDFRSGAKIYNPLEFRILKKAIKFSLLLKIKAAPKELPCGCEKDISKLTFYHKEQCRGELYQGFLIDKEIIVCSKCHSINFEEKYNWICPICSAKFHLHSVIGCKPFSKKKYVINRHYNKSAKNISIKKHNKENKEKNMNNINIYNTKESEIERLAKDLNPYNSKNPITVDLKDPILKRPHTFCEKYNEDINKNLISLKKPKHSTNIIVRKKKHYSTLIEILQKRKDSRNSTKDIKKNKNKNEKDNEKSNRNNYETQELNNNIIRKKKESQYNKYKIFGQQKYLETEDLRGNKKYYRNNSKIMSKNNNINISTNKNLVKENEIHKTEKKIKVRTRFHCKLSPFKIDEELKDENKNKENKENKEILRNAESTDFSSYKTLSSHGNIKYNKNNLFNNLSNINSKGLNNPLNSYRHKNKNSFTDNNDSKGPEAARISKLNEQQIETSYQEIINDLKTSSKKRLETDNCSIRYSLLESNSKFNEPYDYSSKKSSNFKNDKAKKFEELQEASKFSYKSPKKQKKNLYTNIYTEIYRNTEENICNDDEFNIKKDEDEEDNDKEIDGNIDRDEIDVKIDKDESSNEDEKIVRKETKGKIVEDDLEVKIDDDDEKDSISKIEEEINNNINKHLCRKETQGKIVYSDGEDSIDKEGEKKEPIYPTYQKESMHKIHENEEDEDDSMDKNKGKIDENKEFENCEIFSEQSESSQINDKEEKEESNKNVDSEDSQKSENNDDELEDKVESIPFLPMSKKNVRESFILNKDFIYQSVLISQEKLNSLANQTTIPTINESEYNLIKSIGEGTYGVVYLVENNKTLEQFALKKIVCRDYNELIKHKNELELIFSVKHENILSLYGLQFKYLDETTSAIYVLMELAQNDWNKEIKRRMIAKKYYKEYEIVEILKQIIKGFLFLQDKDISHRDIKPQNILLFPNNVYKIADFGEAKNIKNIAQQSTLRGSELYMSPVLYKGYKFNKKNIVHNPYKSDVFSLGYCLVYAMCLNIKVLESLRELTTMRSIISCIDKHIVHHLYSDKLMNLIYKMIEPNEDQRIDFEDLLEELNKNFK